LKSAFKNTVKMETNTKIKSNEREYMKEIDFLGILQSKYWINKKLCKNNPNKDYIFLDEGSGKGDFVKLVKEEDKILIKTREFKGYGGLDGKLEIIQTIKQGQLSLLIYREFNSERDMKKQEIYLNALQKSKFYGGNSN
jgi:hypothetical protein